MMNQNELIKNLLRNTKTKNRNANLLDIANNILELKVTLGDLKSVAETLSISTGMLNEFLQVFRLNKETQELVRSKKIDSVKAVKSLAAFTEKDQHAIAMMLIDKKITNQDLRILHPLRKQFPNNDLDTLIDEIVNSKDRKISIINFLTNETKKTVDEIKSSIRTIVSPDQFLDLTTNGSISSIKISKAGETILRREAKRRGISLQQLVKILLDGNA